MLKLTSKCDIIEKKSLELIAKESQYIITGKIIDIQKSIKYNGLNFHRVKIQISDVIKGNLKQEYIWIEGCISKSNMENIDGYGGAKFYLNEQSVIFIVELEGSYEVNGAYQGKFSIQNNKILNTNSTVAVFIKEIKYFLSGKSEKITIQGKLLKNISSNKTCQVECGGDGYAYRWESGFGTFICEGNTSQKCRWYDSDLPPTIYINSDSAVSKDQNGQIIYLTFDQVKNAITDAFDAWKNASGSYLDFYIYPYNCSYESSCDNISVITWRKLPIGYVAQIENITKYTSGNHNGYLKSCDIKLSTTEFWYIDEDYDFAPHWYSVKSIAMHEIGHFWGLGHTSSSSGNIMYYGNAHNGQSYLGSGDVEGAEFMNREVSGTISGQTTVTWCSGISNNGPAIQIHVVGNVTVESSSTLIIEPGAMVKFASGATLNVYGTIIAERTSTNKIIFTSLNPGNSWGGIRLFSSGSNLNYAKIDYATTGLYIESSSPTVQWTWINNCDAGLSVNGGGPTLSNNTIAYNNGLGINAYNSASISMGYSKNNVIRYNIGGIQAYSYGTVYAYQGSNSILDNHSGTYEAMASSGGNIQAGYNYWGNSSPPSFWFYQGLGGTINYNDPLPSDPNSSRPLTKTVGSPIAGLGIIKNSNLTLGTEDDLNQAYKLWQDKKFDEVINICKIVLSNSKQTSSTISALNLFRLASQENQNTEYESYLQKNISEHKADETGGIAQLNYSYYLLSKQQYNSAINVLDNIQLSYKNSELEKAAKFQKILTLYHHIKDMKNVENSLTEFENKYPNDLFTKDLNRLIPRSNVPGSPKNNNNGSNNNISSEFLINYPNPFNPSTTIQYKLKESGFVTLKVYDVLGKEISTLVNETKESGQYTVTFDASKLSSGTYFYKLSVKPTNGGKEIIQQKVMQVVK